MAQADRVHSTPRRTASKTKRKISAVTHVKKAVLISSPPGRAAANSPPYPALQRSIGNLGDELPT
jgi:hypothetical protein